MKCKHLYILLVVIIFLAGCSRRESVKDTGFYAPYHIADANVPFADNLYTTQFDRVEKIEQDKYGRQYYSYQTYSILLNAQIEIHLISQLEENGVAYYYQDVCYLIRKIEGESFSEEDILQLKERNDWNCRLDMQKCSTISTDEWRSDLVYEDTFQEILLEYLGLNSNYNVLCHGLEHLSDNQQLFIAKVFCRDTQTQELTYEKLYILVYENRRKQPIAICEEMELSLECQEMIQTFRGTWRASG